MKVYVFGAGASLGSQNNAFDVNNRLRAPLINEIFNERYSKHATYTMDSEELANFREKIQCREDKSVEKWLEEQWNAIEKVTPIQSQNSQKRLFGHALFYLWNLMKNVSISYSKENEYKKFLINIRDEGKDFGIISFNYDTLLDKAYQEVFNKTFISMEDYLGENFIKPHGSINWILKKRLLDPPVPSVNDTSLKIKIAMEHFFMDDPIPMVNLDVLDPFIEPLREENMAKAWERLGYPYFYPLVFMPLAQKNLSHVHKFYDQVISKAESILMQAEEIYVIGYRAQDMIIKELFKFVPTGVPLHVVSDASAESISSEIRGWANFEEGSKINGGFSVWNSLHFNKIKQIYV